MTTTRTSCAGIDCRKANTYRVTVVGGTRVVRGAGGKHGGTWCREHAQSRVALLNAVDVSRIVDLDSTLGSLADDAMRERGDR